MGCRGEEGRRWEQLNPRSCRAPGHTSLNLGQSGAAIFVLQSSLKPTQRDLGDRVQVFPLLLPNVTSGLRSPEM